MSDCDLILNYLQDYQWHNAIEMFKSLKPNCVNWGLRSRISDLKKRGHNIESKLDDNGCSKYRLIKQGGDVECVSGESKEIAHTDFKVAGRSENSPEGISDITTSGAQFKEVDGQYQFC